MSRRNPFIEAGFNIAARFAWVLRREQTAMVIRKMREIDPNLQLEPFLREVREYIFPEVLDAHVKQYTTNCLMLDGKLLDIGNVYVLQPRILDPGDTPVFIITYKKQRERFNKFVSGEEGAQGENESYADADGPFGKITPSVSRVQSSADLYAPCPLRRQEQRAVLWRVRDPPHTTPVAAVPARSPGMSGGGYEPTGNSYQVHGQQMYGYEPPSSDVQHYQREAESDKEQKADDVPKPKKKGMFDDDDDDDELLPRADAVKKAPESKCGRVGEGESQM
ncbi:hypothetical protein FN846DRAFT_1004563 [Sphaerosporella brunnea]|uniref:Uncharacterized protein n=1 Tax=Sphaerosporella brunnea TaxID=1250544 RepID=A0A5J5EDY0_9PEZI|nr:hypothetical protein FN846DRAFT_1004563 [Sphaerosporella brunnea]